MKILVLAGGWSAERAISLDTGKACAQSLEEKGHTVRLHDMEKNPAALLRVLSDRPDIVFNALHGTGGEDGLVPSILEMLEIPYTHSGVCASAVAMNKLLARRLFVQSGIPIARGRKLEIFELAESDPADFAPPYVVKPVCSGSSLDVRIIRTPDERALCYERMRECSEQDWMVEAYVPGKELTIGVLETRGRLRALAVTEIRPRSGFYDYRAKYRAGFAPHIVPADIPEALAQNLLDWSCRAHRVLECQGVSRADFRWDNTSADRIGATALLEVNTHPGMTDMSLVPEQARYVGMEFASLIESIIEEALWNWKQKTRQRTRAQNKF